MSNNLAGLTVSSTYGRLVQVVDGFYYDGFGNLLNMSGSGTSGSSGSSGTSGIDGLNGSSGTSGTDGSSGTSGTDGSSGTSGTDGLNGSSGTSGTDGSSGTTPNKSVIELELGWNLNYKTEYYEFTRSLSGSITGVDYWDSSSKGTKIFTKSISYDSNNNPTVIIMTNSITNEALTTTMSWVGLTLSSVSKSITP